MKTRRSVDARMLLRLIIWVLQIWRTMQCFSLVMDDKNAMEDDLYVCKCTYIEY